MDIQKHERVDEGAFENSEDGAIVDDSRRDTGADTGGYCNERAWLWRKH